MQVGLLRTTGLGRRRQAAMIMLAALGVSACAEVNRVSPFNLPPVNPSSPVSPYAEQVSQQTFAYPSFTQVPPKVIDMRPPTAYKTAVIDQVQQRRDVAAWLAAHPQISFDSEDWAKSQVNRVPSRESKPVPVEHDAEAEAFARRLHEEAAKPQP